MHNLLLSCKHERLASDDFIDFALLDCPWWANCL